MSNAEKIRAVMNTLEVLNVPATFDNVSRLTGIYQLLSEIVKDLEDGEHADNAE